MWNPFGMRDRGFMLLFGTITAIHYVLFAFTPITYVTLLVAVILLTTSFLFVASAQNGLASTIGQKRAELVVKGLREEREGGIIGVQLVGPVLHILAWLDGALVAHED